MEKRIGKRIIAGYKTVISYAGKTYSGLIENLSESGAQVITDPLDVAAVDFAPGEHVSLTIEAPTGETLSIQCRIIWSSRIPPHDIKVRLGMEIINPPWDKISYFL